MDDLYPPPPAGVPESFTSPSQTYRRLTWASVCGLAAFALGYLGLVLWLSLTAWRFLRQTFGGGGSPGWSFVLALPALFLIAFLVKGLFFVRRGTLGDAIELSAADEPRLFAFLHRLAAEARAPRPHRVYLSPDVNASVFSDLSFRNLIFPPRKNLVIGLGLVNVLTLDELKAVLAHEYGHFAQRTMAVGSWVYVAQQAIGAIVGRRDGFDGFLAAVSRIDLRLAWIGWGMRLVVWSIRVSLETAFRGILALERGLSRQMEFQADLVSVSLCGSDSLVHALRRLPAADDAVDRALGFALAEGRAGRPLADLYDAQAGFLSQLRLIWNDPALGAVPERPASGAAAHRIFDRHLAEVPRMWATHPPSWEREENAKRHYLPSVLDPRPAWALFSDAAATRRRMTAHLYAKHQPEAAAVQPAEQEATARRLAEAFSGESLKPRYRGVYLSRSPVRALETAADGCGALPQDRAAILSALDALYPASLGALLKQAREDRTELRQLEALSDGLLEAPGGVIRLRGKVVPRKELPGLIEQLKAELSTHEEALAAHDREVRTAHRAAARALGGGHEARLSGLLRLLHCFDHVEADLRDADGVLANVFSIVTADGSVSQAELQRLLKACEELHRVLAAIHAQRGDVLLDPDVAKQLELASWAAALEDFRLQVPTSEALAGNWLQAAHSWVEAARGSLSAASEATLDVLLRCEDEVARQLREGLAPAEVPAPGRAPASYPVLLPGKGRPRQKRLGSWDRFLLADGWGPGALRLAVATLVLAPAFVLTSAAGDVAVVVHNGLRVPIEVTVGTSRLTVGSGGVGRISLAPEERLALRATTSEGRPIEELEVDASASFGKYVYNVAGAGVLQEEQIVYGPGTPREPRVLGAVRWASSSADFLFEAPPRSVQSKGPTTRLLLSGLPEATPGRLLGALAGDAERRSLATVHARFDPITHEGFADWIHVLAALGADAAAVVAERRAQDPGSPANIVLGRLEQDVGGAAACEAQTAAAAREPGNADLAYLGMRCRDNGGDRDAVLAAAARFPDHAWISWALAYRELEQGRWAEAGAKLDAAAPGLLPIRSRVRDLQLRTRRMLELGLPEQLEVIPTGDPAFWRLALQAEATGKLDPRKLEEHGGFERAELRRATGELGAAASLAAPLGKARARHLWMIAASDGATDEQLALALRQPVDEGIDAVAIWPALAVRTRQKADVTRALALAEERQPELLTRLRPALEAKSPAEVRARIDAAALGADPHSRGIVRLVGLLLAGPDAPPAWRAEAKRLLLPWERPYLR